MPITQILVNSLFFALLMNGYLLILMKTFNPRIWGYSDYPQIVKDKVPPPTRQERRTALLVSIPFLILITGYPIYSTLALKSNLGEEFSVLIGFINLLMLFISSSLGDMVILDWLIISKITPDFVIIPGSDKADYKDFTYHFIGHGKAAIIFLPILLIISLIITLV